MYNLVAWHHARTSAVVTTPDGTYVGTVVGYRVPATPAVWFVWQIGVHPEHRGRGLAVRMLEHVARRLRADGVTALQATVCPSNRASLRTFEALAARNRGVLSVAPFLPAEACGPGREAEDLVTIVWPDSAAP
jgi:L-2,4-diaminobutyric acid acetyltransferase